MINYMVFSFILATFAFIGVMIWFLFQHKKGEEINRTDILKGIIYYCILLIGFIYMLLKKQRIENALNTIGQQDLTLIDLSSVFPLNPFFYLLVFLTVLLSFILGKRSART